MKPQRNLENDLVARHAMFLVDLNAVPLRIFTFFEKDPVSVARHLVHEEGRGIFPKGGEKKIVPVFLK
jgi:hypothetical protein